MVSTENAHMEDDDKDNLPFLKLWGFPKLSSLFSIFCEQSLVLCNAGREYYEQAATMSEMSSSLFRTTVWGRGEEFVKCCTYCGTVFLWLWLLTTSYYTDTSIKYSRHNLNIPYAFPIPSIN